MFARTELSKRQGGPGEDRIQGCGCGGRTGYGVWVWGEDRIRGVGVGGGQDTGVQVWGEDRINR